MLTPPVVARIGSAVSEAVELTIDFPLKTQSVPPGMVEDLARGAGEKLGRSASVPLPVKRFPADFSLDPSGNRSPYAGVASVASGHLTRSPSPDEGNIFFRPQKSGAEIQLQTVYVHHHHFWGDQGAPAVHVDPPVPGVNHHSGTRFFRSDKNGGGLPRDIFSQPAGVHYPQEQQGLAYSVHSSSDGSAQPLSPVPSAAQVSPPFVWQSWTNPMLPAQAEGMASSPSSAAGPILYVGSVPIGIEQTSFKPYSSVAVSSPEVSSGSTVTASNRASDPAHSLAGDLGALSPEVPVQTQLDQAVQVRDEVENTAPQAVSATQTASRPVPASKPVPAPLPLKPSPPVQVPRSSSPKNEWQIAKGRKLSVTQQDPQHVGVTSASGQGHSANPFDLLDADPASSPAPSREATPKPALTLPPPKSASSQVSSQDASAPKVTKTKNRRSKKKAKTEMKKSDEPVQIAAQAPQNPSPQHNALETLGMQPRIIDEETRMEYRTLMVLEINRMNKSNAFYHARLKNGWEKGKLPEKYKKWELKYIEELMKDFMNYGSMFNQMDLHLTNDGVDILRRLMDRRGDLGNYQINKIIEMDNIKDTALRAEKIAKWDGKIDDTKKEIELITEKLKGEIISDKEMRDK